MLEKKAKEFAELMGRDVKDVYNEMRRTAIEEADLSGLVRILKDLREIELKNRFDAELLKDILIDPCESYESIGNRKGISRQVIHWRLKQIAGKYPWIKELMFRKAIMYHQNKERS